MYKLRVFLAALVLGGFGLLFLKPTLVPGLDWLAKIQLVPALLAGSLLTAGVLMLLTLLFGRVYCAVVCPLGILQDVVVRIAPRRRFRFTPGFTALRAASLILFAAAFLAGIPLIVSVLEPYSIFGRMAANGASLIHTSGPGVASLTVAALSFAVIGFMAWKKGRLWCNSLCPVGAFLGLLARFSLFKIAFVPARCTRCGLCEKACKVSCLDAASHHVDSSRCVTCFRCLNACRHGGMAYTCKPLPEKRREP